MRRTITINHSDWPGARTVLLAAGFEAVTAHAWRYENLTRSLTGVLVRVEHEAHRTTLTITTPTEPNGHDDRVCRVIVGQLASLKADASQPS